jgi:predicted dehydrogenase
MSLSRWLSPAVAREELYEDLFRVLAPGVPVYYAEYTLDNPEKSKIVAIADPRPNMREIFIRELDRILVFNTRQYLLKASAETIQTIGRRFVDAVIVAVHDYMHYEVVYAFAAQGYHILSEKPMVTSLRDCLDMEKAVKNASIIFGTSHGQ